MHRSATAPATIVVAVVARANWKNQLMYSRPELNSRRKKLSCVPAPTNVVLVSPLAEEVHHNACIKKINQHNVLFVVVYV